MSMRIRMILGPQVALLRTRTAAATALLGQEVDILAMGEAMDLLQKALQRVEAELGNWERVLAGLQGADRVEEQQRFTTFMEDEDRQVAEVLGEAQGALDELQVALAGAQVNGVPASENALMHNEPVQNLLERAEQAPARDVGPVPRIRLPELRMPMFAGDPLEWPSFWQSFESAVHNQEHLQPIDKMNYLFGCLKGKAARAVMGYRGGQNYANMVEALRRLFGNPQVIVEALQAELFNLPNVEDTAESLQPFAENLERICRQLNALGHPENSLMCMAVKVKLPKQILTELVKMEREEGLRWQMSDLRRGLAEIVSLREEVQRCARSLRKERGPNPNRQGFQREQRRQSAERARAFVAASQDKRSREPANIGRTKPPCFFCGGMHFANDCRKVVSIQQRIRLLAEQNRCHVCLRRGHKASDCRSKRGCPRCNEAHNKVICPKGKESGREFAVGGTKIRPQFKRNQANVNVVTEKPIENGTVATLVSDPKSVLLMARHTRVFSDRTPGKGVNGLLFFDPGSQITVAKSAVIKALSPKKLKDGLLEVSGFHSEVPVRLNAPQYKLRIELEDGTYEEIVAYRTEWIVKTVHRAEWIHTTVGPIVCGRDIPQEIGETKQLCTALSVNADCEFAEIGTDVAKGFWDLQTIGICDDPKANDDETAMQIFAKKVVRLSDGRYSSGWPWKEFPPELPSNYNMAYRRLSSLLEKLRKTPELLEKYHESIKREFEVGFFERGERREGYPEHFLPHHGVVTHKLRIVFDASAHPRGEKSLNECMFRGPVMIPDLVGILLRFLLPEIAIWADLEKAFNAISLNDEDREFVKFLWVKDPKKKLSADNLQVFRWARIPFGVISSPFILAAVVQKHLREKATPLALEFAGNAFVDNLMTSCKNAKEVMEKYREGKALFAEAQMNLREFICNSMEAMDQIPEEDRLNKAGSKVLGIPWDIRKDELSIGFPTMNVSGEVSKRMVLRALASIFDPLGIVVPCLLKAKLFLQKLWDRTLGWDEVLRPTELEEWREIAKQWEAEPFKLARRAILEDSPIQLHVFVDASKYAYAAVLFIRSRTKGHGRVQLLYAKSRLKPKKTDVTIPRMELLAMLIGARMLKFAENQLRFPVEGKFIWGDSRPVLSWIASRDIQPRFVENRLKEIRKISERVRFLHIATHENPADVASRGCTPEELRGHQLWWNGPRWLTKATEDWPIEFEVTPAEDAGTEERPVIMFPALANAGVPWIDPTRFSCWLKLRRTVVWVLRAANAMAKSRKFKISEGASMTSEDYEEAEVLLLKMAQDTWPIWKARPLELIKTSRGEDALIRLTTRLALSTAPKEMVNPVILPEDCPITRLIAQSVHEALAHSGTESSLTDFLGRYWTPKARTIMKRANRPCGRCRRIQCPAFKLPEMPPYPEGRVRRTAPFESIGIDYLGPTNTKVGGEVRKAWIALFTCLSTRAIYLEPVLDLSAESFLQVFRRFASRRGTPKRFITDNGTQFVLAAKVAAAMEAEKAPSCPLEAHLAREGIRWRFNPSLRPWSNGFLERQVAGVKAAFKRVLGRRVLPIDELRSFVAEVEATLNQRPITYVDEGPDGLLPLRPIDFLLPKANLSMSVGHPSDEAFEAEPKSLQQRLVAQWRSTMANLDEFWARWKKEYLLMLRNRLQWEHNGPRSKLVD